MTNSYSGHLSICRVWSLNFMILLLIPAYVLKGVNSLERRLQGRAAQIKKV